MFSPELLLAGLGLGAAYALAALGFVLIINAVGAVNFAQGDFVMAGGYVAVVVTALLPPSLAPGLLALPLVLVAMAVLGLLFSALAYLPLRGQPAVAVFISTIAVGLILRQSVNAVFGAAPRAGPPVLAPEMAGAMFSQVATIAAAALLVAAVHGLLKHTQFGRHLRASAQDPEMAAAIGVPVTWMVMATFALATALARVRWPVAVACLSGATGRWHDLYAESLYRGHPGRLGPCRRGGARRARHRRLRDLGRRPGLASDGRGLVVSAGLGRAVVATAGPDGRDRRAAGVTGRHVIALGLAVAVAAALLAGVDDYGLRLLTLAAIYAIAVLGYQLALGHAGVLSLAQGAFFGVGAYVSGILTTTHGWDGAPALAAGALTAAGLAAFVAVPVLRLETHYFALATLAIAEVVHLLAVNWTEMTGGANGIYGVPPLALFGFVVAPGWPLLIAVSGVLAAMIALATWRVGGRRRLVLALARTAPLAADCLGIARRALRFELFVLGAGMGGLAGALQGHTVGVVSPAVTDFALMVSFLVAALIGGRDRRSSVP